MNNIENTGREVQCVLSIAATHSYKSVSFFVHSSIALDYGMDVRGFESRQGLGIFFFTTASRLALGPTQPHIQVVPGALSLGVKRPRREANHSPPSSDEVKEWSYTSSHQYAFMQRRAQSKACGNLYLLQEYINFTKHFNYITVIQIFCWISVKLYNSPFKYLSTYV
jgi:hypothetical protein